MDKFRDQIQSEMKNMPPWVSADQRRAWYKAVSAWLYSTDHIRLRYGIEYDGVAIEHLSPGTRGVVLLLLYLAVDLHDQRPLIIDQPEENLASAARSSSSPTTRISSSTPTSTK
jgi:hypothetical protein